MIIEAENGYDKNKYLFVKLTESSRLMRGAREASREYIFELCTEQFHCARRISAYENKNPVGCNVVAHVISAGVIKLLSNQHVGISIALWQLPEVNHVSDLRKKVVSRSL